MDKKVLFEYYHDCHRMGSVEGLFIATKKDLNDISGQTIYFGEILGKHSEVMIDFDWSDITIKSEDQDFINKLEDLLGTTISGYNPLDYYEEIDDEQ